MRTRLLCTLGLVSLLASAPALAQTPPPPPADAAAQADALIHEGVQLRVARRDADALERFNRAYALAPTPRARAQQGFAEQALGRWAPASRHLHDALSAANDPWIQSHRATIDAAVHEVDQHVGHLDVLGNVAGAEVRVDGEVVATLPLATPLVVPAGRFALEIRAAGYTSVVREVDVAAGSLARESVTLIAQAGVPASTTNTAATTATTTTTTPSTASPPPRNAPPASETTAPTHAMAQPVNENPPPGASGSVRPILAISAVVLGVVSLGVGAAGSVIHEQNASSWNTLCSVDATTYTPDSQCNPYASNASTGEALAITGYVLGGVLIAGGAVLWLTTPRESQGPRASSRTVRCGPWLGAAGLSCAGTF